ncbi:hypothetical protein HMPREF0202_00563 [Cetobacterium somerae ATCC BAA-474]|uniref:Uncharacterized protein n=1 Tax=Cetobacterium somerae ATCC BAA-474 TaxID=1319815 RepID=U7VDB3_9FUSO|nr:hypothetical protein HMPREF0202_00563 [Cetobacterium somerae ATCC BAA-474]
MSKRYNKEKSVIKINNLPVLKEPCKRGSFNFFNKGNVIKLEKNILGGMR